MWINFTIFFTLYFINMILITYVTLCSNPYAEYPPFPLYSLTSSLPFSWFIIILMFKMYNVHCFYLQFSFVYSGPTNYNNLLWLKGAMFKRCNVLNCIEQGFLKVILNPQTQNSKNLNLNQPQKYYLLWSCQLQWFKLYFFLILKGLWIFHMTVISVVFLGQGVTKNSVKV